MRGNDLLGMIFEELTVIELYEKGGNGRHNKWKCMCSCGETTVVSSSSLKSGHTRSCGHLAKEISSVIHKKYNEYIFENNICYGRISDEVEFILDSEDYEKIKNYKWCLDKGYASSHDPENNFKKIRLHRIIMGAKKGEFVDHINRDRLDNRKENLRFATPQQNATNISISSANKTGIIGVHLEKNGKWRVSIKGIHSGKRYDKFENAVVERLRLEKEIFGEDFAPQRHLFEKYGI